MESNAAPAAPSLPGERRRLTLLFTDLSGSTAIGRQLEPEQYRLLMHALRQVWQEAASRFAARVVSAQGDGAILAFGLEGTSEVDGLHAVQAALHIHQAVAAMRPEGVPAGLLPLQMHSGVHAGLLLVALGDDDRDEPDLTGDVTNAAAHLSKRARAGQLLVTQAALGPHAQAFELSDPPPERRDRAAEAGLGRVFRVIGPRPVRRGAAAGERAPLQPFIGRGAELARLLDFAGDTRTDAARCLVVMGEAGIGKTRLLEQFSARAGALGLKLLRGVCEHGLGAEPLHAFSRMVRPAGGHAELPATPAAWRARLEALHGAGPVLLLLDDWQWADDASRQVLAALLSPGGRWRAVLAGRPDPAAGAWQPGVQTIELAPFDIAQTQAAVRRLLPQADPFLAQRIHDYAGGVPLYIEELCHSASAQTLEQALQRGGATQGWLSMLVASRLDRLTPALREVAQAAAVVGRFVPQPLLQAALGRAPDPAALQALAEADFLRPMAATGDTLAFKHGITRDAVYEASGLNLRRAMHRRVAEHIQRTTPPEHLPDVCEALAYHLGGADQPAQAAHFAELAGNKAMAASAIDLAKGHFRSALLALGGLPDRHAHYEAWRSIARRLGFVSVFDPSLDDPPLFELARGLAREQGDVPGAAYAGYWLAYVHYALGNTRTAVRCCRQALEDAARIDDPRLQAQLRLALGQALATAARPDEALATFDAPLRLARRTLEAADLATRVRLAPAVAYATACRAAVLGDMGQFALAEAGFDEALGLCPAPGHEVESSVLCWRASVRLWQGRWSEALADAQAAQQVAERVRSSYQYAMSRSLGARARWCLHGEESDIAALRESTAWLTSRGKHLAVSLNHGWLADMAATLGRGHETRLHAAQALRRWRDDDALGAAMAARALAAVETAAGYLSGAGRHLALAERAARRRGAAHEAVHNLVARADLAAAAGAPEQAAEDRAQALAAMRALGMGGHLERAPAAPARQGA